MQRQFSPRKSSHRFWASVFCSLLLAVPLWAQRQTLPIVLGGGGGIALGVGASELFDGYRAATGLRANDFDVPLVASGAVLVDFGGVRVGAAADYFRTQFLERGSPQTAPQRVLEERMQLDMMPVLLTVEWEPWHDQFRSYLSAAVGAAFARFQWYESVWTDGRLERSGPNADDRRTVPAVRIGAGTYLLFDADPAAVFRGGLVLQMHYTYSPVQLAALRRYTDGNTNATLQQWTGDIAVGGSALVLSLSVRFQIGRHH